MTVQESSGDGDVVCVWFEKSRQNEGVFKAAMLRIYRPSGPMVFAL